MMHFYGFGFWPWLGGGIFMVFFWIILIALVAMAIRSAGFRHYYHGDTPAPRKAGLDILNERYAKGEITKEEYEQKKKDILS